MDYEKRYRDLIKRLKEERDGDNDYEPFCHVANEILDEFGENESEDERIRRTLAEYFGPEAQLDLVRGVPIQKIRDWLEKQKEQKPNYCHYGGELKHGDKVRIIVLPKEEQK